MNLENATRKGNYIKTSMLPQKPASSFQQVVLLKEVSEKDTFSVSLAYQAAVNSSSSAKNLKLWEPGK